MSEFGVTREYHIIPFINNAQGLKTYDVVITYGLLNTKTISYFTSLKSAREYCKRDAMIDVVRPIIIVQ